MVRLDIKLSRLGSCDGSGPIGIGRAAPTTDDESCWCLETSVRQPEAGDEGSEIGPIVTLRASVTSAGDTVDSVC
jgi:hypothetical protein